MLSVVRTDWAEKDLAEILEYLDERRTICWVIGPALWYYDPLDFQIEVCPETGAFKRYVLRFGDSRPLSAKVKDCETAGLPAGGWAYEFERRILN
jgi:hypothetical protein